MLEAALLGIVQGLTEFLPISSSAHLVIIPEIFGWEEKDGLFDLTVHGGTLFALLIVYRKQIFKLAKERNGTFTNIAIATLPALFIGGLLVKYFETLKSIYLISFMLIVIGIPMIAVDFQKVTDQKKLEKTNSIRDISLKKTLIIGLAQTLAFMRGTSRSGITIIAGKLCKLDNKTAVDFSFFLGIPIIATGFLYGLIRLIGDQPTEISNSEILIGFLSSFLSGIIAIKLMLKTTERVGFKWFGFYRIILAVFLLIFVA
ncbi:hypothetical protein GF389_04590 [Candidatus Dojkabacteria bacterium]|nr:hypothetical protein [Candidatus Dojkabacteria bacterium]